MIIPVLTDTQLALLLYGFAGFALAFCAAVIFEYTSWMKFFLTGVFWPAVVAYGILYVIVENVIHMVGVKKCRRWAATAALYIALRLR